MNPYSSLSPALTHVQLYVLLALASREMHGYDVYATVLSGSMGTVRPGTGRTYTAIKEMLAAKLIEEAGEQQAGKQGKLRMMYQVSNEGMLRLKSELKRMKHTVDIGERLGLMADELPSEIQRLLNSLR